MIGVATQGKTIPGIDTLLIAFHYGRSSFIKKLIHLLKYKGDRTDIPKLLAHSMVETIIKNESTHFHVIIPVPLHPKRKNMRGFNQSELLAKEILENFPQAKLDTTSLRRIKNTIPQVKVKLRTSRLTNVQNAFFATDTVQNKSILLIDDVCSTGATLSACARELKKKGAAKITAAVVARND